MKKVLYLIFVILPLCLGSFIYSMEQEKQVTSSTVQTFFADFPEEIRSLVRNPEVSQYCWEKATELPGDLIGSHENRTLTLAKNGVYIWNNGKFVKGISLNPCEPEQFRVKPICDAQCTRLATPGLEDSVDIWDVKNGTALSFLWHHNDRIRALAFNTKGDMLVTGSADKTAKVWDVCDGNPMATCLATLEGHSADIRSVSFNKEGTLVLTVSNDGTARLWDPRSGACRAILGDQNHKVYAAGFNKEGSKVITFDTQNDQAKVWDVHTWVCELFIKATNKERIWVIKFAPNDKQVITLYSNKAVKIWNLDGTCHAFTWENRIEFSPTGTKIAAYYPDGTIKIIDSHDGSCIATLAASNTSESIARIRWNQQETALVTTDKNNSSEIRIWDAKTWACRVTKTFGDYAHGLEFDTSGTHVLIAGNMYLAIYDLDGHCIGSRIRLPKGQMIDDSIYNGLDSYTDLTYKHLIGNTVKPYQPTLEECMDVLKKETK